MTRSYRAAWLLARILLWGLFGFRTEGVAHCPRQGPLLVAANHVSWLDPVVLGAALPRQVVFVGAEDLLGIRVSPGFVPWRGLLRVIAPMVRWFGMIPVRRTEVEPGAYTGSALRAALRVLRGGGCLVLFPEGGVNRTADILAPLRPGIALLSARAQAPILPAWIFGTDRALPLGEVIPRPVRVGVRFGPTLPPPQDGSDPEIARALEKLRTAMIGLHDAGAP